MHVADCGVRQNVPMTKLSEIIDAASNDDFSTTNLLRKVQIVAHRLKAESVTLWVKSELFGYPKDETVPAYRGPFATPVQGTWVNPARHITTAVTSVGLPPDFIKANFTCIIRQPVADLEELVTSEQNPGVQWDPYTVHEYNRFVESGQGGAGFELMMLLSANQTVPRNHIRGIIDSVRTTALQLALDLEEISPEAGEPGGPTTDNPEVRQVTNNFNFTIHGDGNNIAAGSEIHQKSKVTKGDLAGLRKAASELGLEKAGLEALEAAVTEDGDSLGKHTSSFLDRVRGGAYSLGAGVASNVAADQLMQLVGAFFGFPPGS